MHKLYTCLGLQQINHDQELLYKHASQQIHFLPKQVTKSKDNKKYERSEECNNASNKPTREKFQHRKSTTLTNRYLLCWRRWNIYSFCFLNFEGFINLTGVSRQISPIVGHCHCTKQIKTRK